MRTRPETVNVPIIVVTSKDDMDADMRARLTQNVDSIWSKSILDRSSFLTQSDALLPEYRLMEKTLLYIEDNYHNRRLVQKVLSSRGFDVMLAEDGLLGWEMVQKYRPKLVLLDISLPGLDGIEIVSRIKADEELKSIWVIALTASAMRGDRERFLVAGCDDYLSKPIQVRELLTKVEDFFNSHQ